MNGTNPVSWNVLGDIVVCKVSGQETGGTHSLFHVVCPAGHGPPPHVHRREDETFYILDGDFEFQTQGKTVRVGAGGAFFAPRNVPHSFRNAGVSPGRMLVLASPAGLERFFEECDREIGGNPPDVAKLVAVLARHGIELIDAPSR